MKKWYLSKTIWLGVAAVAVAGLQAYQTSGDWITAVIAGFGVASIALRAVTKDPVKK